MILENKQPGKQIKQPGKQMLIDEARRRYQLHGLRKSDCHAYQPGPNWNKDQIKRWLKKNPIQGDSNVKFVEDTLNTTNYGLDTNEASDHPPDTVEDDGSVHKFNPPKTTLGPMENNTSVFNAHAEPNNGNDQQQQEHQFEGKGFAKCGAAALDDKSSPELPPTRKPPKGTSLTMKSSSEGQLRRKTSKDETPAIILEVTPGGGSSIRNEDINAFLTSDARHCQGEEALTTIDSTKMYCPAINSTHFRDEVVPISGKEAEVFKKRVNCRPRELDEEDAEEQSSASKRTDGTSMDTSSIASSLSKMSFDSKAKSIPSLSSSILRTPNSSQASSRRGAHRVAGLQPLKGKATSSADGKASTSTGESSMNSKDVSSVKEMSLEDNNGRAGKYIGAYCYSPLRGEAVPHGEGIMSYNSGMRYDGHWSEGVWDGYGIVIYSKEDWYAGYFENGSFDGQGTRQWPEGSSYDGNWKGGKRAGRGTYKDCNGGTLEGRWVNDRMEGPGLRTNADGSQLSGIFIGGELQQGISDPSIMSSHEFACYYAGWLWG